MLYLRYSSNSQTEQSIEGQRRVCTEYAVHNDIDIVGEYVDRATSASHDVQKRLSFQKMIKDSAYKRFDCVIVYKLDRFARNRYDAAENRQKLKANGVKLLSATEGLSDSPESVMLESVLEGMAEYYSLELSQKVRRGINESVEKRQFLGGPIPLGFMIVDKKLVPDPEQKEIVKELFEEAAGGASLADLERFLRAKGVRNTRGQPYKRTSITGILRSKRYIGFYCYGDIEIPDVIEPMVEKEIFMKAQKMLTKNKFRKRTKEDFLLLDKLYCGVCEEKMTGVSGTSSTGARHAYYKCYGRAKGHCHLPNIRKDELEKAVADQTRACLDDEMMEKIVAAVMTEYESSDSLAGVKRLEKQVAETTKKIGNVTDLLANGVVSAALLDKLKSLESEKAEMLFQLEVEKAQAIPLNADMIRYWLEQLKAGQMDDKTVINTLVNCVYLYPDDGEGRKFKIEMHFNCAGPNVRSLSVEPHHRERIRTDWSVDLSTLTICFVRYLSI